MKQRITQAIVLIAFTTMIAAFVIYKSQPQRTVKATATPKTPQILVEETPPEDHAKVTQQKQEPTRPMVRKTQEASPEVLETSTEDSTVSEEETQVIMSGSKSITVKDFKAFDFTKLKKKP